MSEFLRSLDHDRFVSYIEELHGIQVIVDGKMIHLLHPRYGAAQADAASWREEETETILSARESNRPLWNEACALAGIQTDDAVQLEVAKASQRLAMVSLVIGGSALLWNILEAGIRLLR